MAFKTNKQKNPQIFVSVSSRPLSIHTINFPIKDPNGDLKQNGGKCFTHSSKTNRTNVQIWESQKNGNSFFSVLHLFFLNILNAFFSPPHPSQSAAKHPLPQCNVLPKHAGSARVVKTFEGDLKTDQGAIWLHSFAAFPDMIVVLKTQLLATHIFNTVSTWAAVNGMSSFL